MTTITIYNPTGEVVHEAPITKDARVFRKLGGDYYVELTLSVAKILDLPKGSYIEILDPTTDPETTKKEKYALRSDATPEPISGVNGYKYVLKFYSRQHDMEACQIKWLAGGSKELSFRVTTSLRGFAQLIADNMNAYLDENAWSYDGTLDDTDMREQVFGGVSCWDAINNIANAFGVEWWVDHGEKLTIHFGKCENDGDATDIREGEIVNRFPAPKRCDDSNYGTRFYIFGGTQNVPESYRSNNTTSGGTTFHIAEKRIQLCKIYGVGDRVSKEYYPYFDAVEVPKGEIVEKTIILDNIFPKNETTIGAGDILTQDENIIEGEEKQPVYYIKVEKKLTALSTLGITFTSGALSGRSFGAAYTTQQGAICVKVLHTTENSGGASLIAVPNANLAPKAGDKYILTGVELDEDSITTAERELWDKGTELASQRANDTNVYDCPVDPVYCKEQNVNLALGAKVNLKGAHFGEEGRKSRIQGYEKKLYNPYIATYNIGDNSVYSRTLKIYKELNATVTEAIVAGNKNITPTKGEKGEPGVSISNVEVEYAVIDSNNTFPDNDVAWSKDVPVRGEGQYIWSRTKIYYSEGDHTTSDPACISGEKGDKGAQGDKGDKGDKGAQGNFTEYRYRSTNSATSAPSVSLTSREPSFWSTTQPALTKNYYIWQITATINGATNELVGQWSSPIRITPINGIDGEPGVSITNVVVEYAISNSNTTAPTTGWSTIAPQWEDGKYIWSRTKTTYSEGNPTYSEAVCITGGKGDNGSRGPALRGPQDWNDIDDDYQFYSGADGEPFIDVVLYDGNYYLCKTTHTKGTNSTFKPSTSSTYWTESEKFDIIATKLLLSDYALIEKLGVGAVEMKDSNGAVLFKAANGNVDCKTGTFENVDIKSGIFGPWHFSEDGLSNTANQIFLKDVKISCSYSYYGRLAAIGTNVSKDGTDAILLARFENTHPEIWTPTDKDKYNVQISTQGSKSRNVAIDIQGGCIQGLAMSNKVVTASDLLPNSSTYTIKSYENNILYTADKDGAVTLPEMQPHDDGHVVRITNLSDHPLLVKTSYCYTSYNSNRSQPSVMQSSGEYAPMVYIKNKGDSAEFVWVKDLNLTTNTSYQGGTWVSHKSSEVYYLL